MHWCVWLELSFSYSYSSYSYSYLFGYPIHSIFHPFPLPSTTHPFITSPNSLIIHPTATSAVAIYIHSHLHTVSSYNIYLINLYLYMDHHPHHKRRRKTRATYSSTSDQEVSSIEWEFISMSEQEEDLIYRMYNLVGPRWALIAGRIPTRKPEEIERFWIMRYGETFANRRKEQQQPRLQPQTPYNS